MQSLSQIKITDREIQASTNYKEAFALFDKRGSGRVELASLGDLLRACGQNPTLAEIRDLEKNVGGDCEPSLGKRALREVLKDVLMVDLR